VKAKGYNRRLGNELEIDIGYPYIIIYRVRRSIAYEERRRDEAGRGCSGVDV
jgi:hypothetical protein